MDPATTTNARYVEYVHCSRCGKRCSGVDPELGLVVRAWVECPECIEKSEGNFSTTIPQRLHEAIQRVINATRSFDERRQEIWCRVCRYKDETALHDPTCPIYELHDAWEKARKPTAEDAQSQLLDLERDLRESLRGGYLFQNFDEPLNAAGLRVVRVIQQRLSDLPCECTDRTPDVGGYRCRACGGRLTLEGGEAGCHAR